MDWSTSDGEGKVEQGREDEDEDVRTGQDAVRITHPLQSNDCLYSIDRCIRRGCVGEGKTGAERLYLLLVGSDEYAACVIEKDSMQREP